MPRLRLLLPVLAALAAAACERSPAGSGPRACGGEAIELAPGEVLELEPRGGECALAAAAGAEYALVYLDTRTVDAAARGVEPAWRQNETYSVQITDASAAASASGGVSPALAWSPEAGDVVMQTSPASRSFYDRATQWTLGDTVMTPGCPPDAPSCTGERARVGRVARVYDGWMVLAVLEGELAPGAIVSVLDQAYPLVKQHGVPLMGTAFGAPRPITSAGSGQLLVVAGSHVDTRPSRSWSRASGDSVNAWIELWLDAADVPRATSLLAHEMAHAYQRAWLHASRSPGVAGSSADVTRWGVEGGANLISYEVVRRIAGAPLAGNFDWRNPGPDPFLAYYALRAQSSSGDVTGGYDGTMPFLRDLVIRRVQRGEPVDAAVREVSRGAIEGWSGVDAQGSTRPGLVSRMSAVLGSGWRPDDALLTWALSVVGDDRNPGAVYQDPASLRVWDVRPGEYGWHPDGALRGGSGATVTAARPYGSPGYSYLADPGTGMRLRLWSSVPDVGMRWMVMRIT
jgi:hypothetical protein